MEHKEQILCFGEILWDTLPTGRKPGGAPMNVALHLNRFGIKSIIASSVGNDQDGKKLLNFLKSTGLDTRLVQINEELPTSDAKVILDKNNNATFVIVEPVAWDDIKLDSDLIQELSNSRAFVYGSLVARSRATRETLLALLDSDVLKIMDVNLRPPNDKEDTVKSLLGKSDIIKLNEDELITITNWYQLTGDLTQRMSAFQQLFNFKSLIVTRGKDGARLLHEGKFYEHPGFKVETVDTVGSGDAFLAGFIAAYFGNKDLNQAITEACAVGAFVATKSGATPEYTMDDIKSLIS
jgi:fructokinase